MATTTEIMDKVKEKFVAQKTSGGSLSALRTIQQGAIGSQAVFPALAIVPRDERVTTLFSNGSYTIERRFTIEVYDRQIRSENSFDRTTQYIDSVREICENNENWDGLAISSEWMQDSYGSHLGLSNTVMFMSSMDLSIRSRDVMPTRTVPSTIANSISPELLAERIKNILADSSNQSSYDYARYGIHFFSKTLSPQAMNQIPLVFVSIPNKNRNFKKPRANNPVMPVDIHIITNLVTRESSLRFNLAIKEKILDVLEARYSFDDGNGEGYAENSTLETILYDLDKENLLYHTQLTINVNLREYVDQA